MAPDTSFRHTLVVVVVVAKGAGAGVVSPPMHLVDELSLDEHVILNGQSTHRVQPDARCDVILHHHEHTPLRKFPADNQRDVVFAPYGL